MAASFFKTENIDMSDPKLQEAWKDLTNDKSTTNWYGSEIRLAILRASMQTLI